jgi:trehalose synthase
VQEIHVSPRPVRAFEPLLGEARIHALEQRGAFIRKQLGDRAIWNINSTAVGGGVSEMLRSLLRYARDLKVDVRWLVIEAPPEFFRMTKRVHNALHGSGGDGSALGPEQSALYTRVAHDNASALRTLVKPGDVVICHDPQTAGLIPLLLQREVHVIWRCHIGHEKLDNPEVERVPVAVFSREAYAPAWLRGKRTVVLPPNIDPFSAKNQALEMETVRAILQHVGLIAGQSGEIEAKRCFTRDDGSSGRVDRQADVLSVGHAPTWETPLVVQISRWDEMKDPSGVLHGFLHLLHPEAPRGAHLVLAGPGVHAVADDPEGAKVFGDLQQEFLALPQEQRSFVHLATLPMEDTEENAAIVNALQRHAAVIVQKSFVEGFGLTVTEAMWKGRPVVASAVGGILDQIRDGEDGLLLRDPRSQEEFATTLEHVLDDEALADHLGKAAYARVRDHYLCVTALERWAELLTPMLQK